MSVGLAPGETDSELNGNWRGTAECANSLSMTPDCAFTGVTLENEQLPANGATILEGLQAAVALDP